MKIARLPLSRLICFLVISFLLSSCGFRPLYAPALSTGNTGLSLYNIVSIKGLKDRLGQAVYTELSNQLLLVPAPSDKRYILSIILKETESDLALDREGVIIRKTYKITATYQLQLQGSNHILLKGVAQSDTNFNYVLSGYAAYVAREEAQLRLAKELAYQIYQRVSIFITAS
ncbi:MAG TPA: LPS assembly lipoprotein LptE [Alphaproteobacteria bacterium]|nr:LPS assembly lipoprotein LptE [Alphaproteobacteria bacterium]